MAPQEQPSSTPAPELAPPASPDITRIEKSALQKLDVARSLATAANRVFLLFFVSLLLLWTQRVFPAIGQLNGVGRARTRFLNSVLITRLDLEQAYQRQLNDARADPFELPGGFKLKVPAYYAPLVWGFLCLTLIAYLHFCRRRHFALAARGLRSLREDAGYPPAALSDLAPALPWWLAPLPRRDGKVITSAEFYSAFGWVASRRRIAGLGFAAIAALIVLQLYTLYLSWRTSALIAIQSKTEQFWTLEATALMAILTVLIAVDWMRPARVPDNRITELNPNQLGRREFIGASTLTTLSLLPYPIGNLFQSFSRTLRHTAYSGPRTPRFKPKRKHALPVPAVASNATALLNRRSGVVHYIAHDHPDQRCLHGIQVSWLDRLTPVDFVHTVLAPDSSLLLPPPAKPQHGARPAAVQVAPQPDAAPQHELVPVDRPPTLARSAAAPPPRPQIRIHSDYESWCIQQEATKALEKGNPALACKLLLRVLQSRPDDLRLYDRLASITVQHKLPHERQELIQFAETRVPHLRGGEAHSRASSSGGAGSPAPSLMDDLARRVIGQAPSKPVIRRVRGRHRCLGGKLAPRKAPGGGKISEAEALRRRIANWENPSSKWYLKWANGKREWKEPARAVRCRPA
jgi:hypothetical protein